MSSVQSISRANELLRLISADTSGGIRLLDLVTASGLSQPTTHRLLQQLVHDGLLMQDGQRRYCLGPFAYELGLLASQHFPLRTQCQPALERISTETGDAAFLMVRSGNHAFCLERQSGSFPIQVLTVQVGQRRPLGVGGGGLALLAFMPETELPAMLDRIEPQLAPYEGLTRAVLQELIYEARAQGWARSDYAGAGVTSIGVPVYARNGSIRAAISVSAMTARMQPRLEMVVQTLLHQVAALGRGEKKSSV